MDGFNRARIDVCRLGAPLRSDHCDHNVTEICPLQSIRVTYTRDRCAYVVDLTLYTAESTAFTRQGSLVQSSRAHDFPLLLGHFHWPLSTPISLCLNIVRKWRLNHGIHQIPRWPLSGRWEPPLMFSSPKFSNPKIYER